MADHTFLANLVSLVENSERARCFLNDTKDRLKGADRRQFMGQFVQLMGRGGQLFAERELGWNRKTIAKGINYSAKLN